MPVPFDSLARLILSDSYIDLEDPSRLHDLKVFKIATYQNPLLPINSSHDATVTVVGEVERISYEPAEEVEDRIEAYALGGLLWLVLSSRKGEMAAYAQYRFTIKDISDHTLDSFLIIGVSAGDPQEKSRKELMAEANYIAAEEFAGELVLRIAKLNDLTLEHLASRYVDPEERARRCKDYFEAKLKTTDIGKKR